MLRSPVKKQDLAVISIVQSKDLRQYPKDQEQTQQRCYHQLFIQHHQLLPALLSRHSTHRTHILLPIDKQLSVHTPTPDQAGKVLTNQLVTLKDEEEAVSSIFITDFCMMLLVEVVAGDV